MPLLPYILGGLGVLGIAWLASRDNEAKGQPAKLPGPRPSPQPPQPSPPSTQGLRGPPGEPMEPVIIQRHGGGGTGPQGTRRPGDLRGATVHFAAGTQGGELENVLYELKKAGLDYNAAVPRSGKIVELAVRNIVHGRAIKNVEALANPEALELFKDRAELAV